MGFTGQWLVAQWAHIPARNEPKRASPSRNNPTRDAIGGRASSTKKRTNRKRPFCFCRKCSSAAEDAHHRGQPRGRVGGGTLRRGRLLVAQLRRFRRLVIVFYLENSFVFPVNTCPNHSLVEEGNAKNYAKTQNELVLSGIIF